MEENLAETSIILLDPVYLLPPQSGAENFFSVKDYLDMHNYTHRPCKIINFKISVLYSSSEFKLHLWLPWQGQIKSFCEPYMTHVLDVPNP